MLHLVSTLAHIISYAAWLGITCYPYFRTVGFLRKWIRWPVGFNMFLFKEQNTYLTFTEFEAISPLYWWANIFTNSTTPPYFYLLYFHSFKELQYKYNKKFWNFQTFFNFFEIFFVNRSPYKYNKNFRIFTKNNYYFCILCTKTGFEPVPHGWISQPSELSTILLC